ncbi:MAG: S-layer homology domain-containing protein [Microthrixaceae bacterium]
MLLGGVMSVNPAAAGALPNPAPLGAVGDIGVGTDHTCAVMPDGALRCWGHNRSTIAASGKLGDGTLADSLVPVGVVGVSNAVRVDGGVYSSCAVLASGDARCWGLNTYGGLGDGTTSPSTMPVAVSGISDALDVAVGVNHACALIDDGTVQCWGRNSTGQLGNNSTVDSSVPVMVTGISDAKAITAFFNSNCALLSDETVKCWGQNNHGQLGNGTTANALMPTPVAGLTGAGGLASGQYFACAVSATGVWCWGENDRGQLGDGTTTDSSVPVAVSALGATAELALGEKHACARLAGGTIKCWGDNRRGQLGDGTTTDSPVPVAVVGLSGVKALAAGGESTCAQGTALSCWGLNSYGQLGSGTRISSSSPVEVVAGLCEASPDPGFGDVSASSYYADAVAWLAAMGISTGTAPGVYSPNAVVSRKDMAVFIWRAFDSPAPQGANPFGDVPAGQYYTDAIAWLAEQGISTGTSPGMFSPDAPVVRRDMAVFLHRATGSLGAPLHSFGDVASGVYYEAAVSWLADVGISKGTSPGVYSPNAQVTRKDMAVFLNRRGCGAPA